MSDDAPTPRPTRRTATAWGPRTRRLRAVALAAMAVLVGTTLLAGHVGATPAASAETTEPNRVLLLSAPGLRWIDLVEEDLPAIEGLVSGSSTALLSLRTIGARTALGEGYLTVGAGNRASGRADIVGLGLAVDEPFEDGLAADAFERRTGAPSTGAIVHLGYPSITQTNDRYLYGADPGALGQALADAGRSVAVVANGDKGLVAGGVAPASAESVDPMDDEAAAEASDLDGTDDLDDADAPAEPGEFDADDAVVPTPATADADYGRSAVAALMDDSGQVPAGTLDGLLTTDPAAPFGVRYDPTAVMAAFGDHWGASDVVLVELSDLDRADAYRREADPAAGAELWSDALARSDELVSMVLAEVDLTETTVILFSPSAPRDAESLGVFAAHRGDGRTGLAQSGTTRRPGYVTLADVGPAVLDALGIPLADSMTGTPIALVEEHVIDGRRFEVFADATERAVFRDAATGPVSVVFVIVQILAYALAAVAVARRRRWVRPVSFLALVVLATPTVGFAAGSLELTDVALSPFVAAIFGVAVVLAGMAELAGSLVARRWPETRAVVAPLLLVGLSWSLLVFDIATGGRLQIDTVFGYSPIVAGRFAGFGNLAFALLAVGAVVVACGGWAAGRLARGPADGSARLSGWSALAVSAFLGLTIVVDGAPSLGSDVGGVLATVPAFAVLVLVARGVRIDVRRGALIAVATGVVLGAFAAIDLARPPESRTHLGRLVERVLDGGGIAEVLERKLNTNINILTSSIWTLTIPFALGLMVFLARRDRGFLRDLQVAVPGIRALLAGGLLVAVLGFALNDSGVAVPAMMFAVLLPYLTYVLLRWQPSPD